jgi:aryl-phospho-beta-D-glucosidase BglC (GH1 family)
MLGVNLSGAEYGPVINARYGYDYIYPSNQEIDYYAFKQMKIIRVPLQWERMQPTLNGFLDPAELGRLKALVTYANSKGMMVVIDSHDYGFRNIGSTAFEVGVAPEVPASALADFWGRVAAEFKGKSVLYGLMNEPHSQSATEWLPVINASIAAIRNAGATEKILVPGTYWDGAHSWVSSDNDTVIGANTVDPLNNYAFEVHQYLDSNSSGSSSTAVSTTIGVERLIKITEWARANNKDLFLGEFGAANNATALAALDNMVRYMDSNTDVWIGATYWAGGPWWGEYMFTIEPKDLKTLGNGATDRAQMDILEKYDLKPGVVMRTITGTSASEEIKGTSAPEMILGLGGNDKLHGSGPDVLKGGAGNDIYFAGADDAIIEAAGAGEGTDTVSTSASHMLAKNIETLTLTGSTAANATGNSAANTLDASSGKNVLTGAGGNDTFDFDSIAQVAGDAITDFSVGDRIDLTSFSGTFVFRGTGAFTAGSPQVRYVQDSAASTVYLDTNGDNVADASFTTNRYAFSSADFAL